jgi:hypothetical protein
MTSNIFRLKKILLVVSLFFCANLYAQNDNLDYKYAIKVYNKSQYTYSKTLSQKPNGNQISTATNNLKILNPEIAFQWTNKKKHFNEIGISNYNLERQFHYFEYINGQVVTPTGGGVSTNFNIAFRFEHSRQIIKKWDKKWIPFLGMGINQGFSSADYKPFVNGTFPSNYKNFNTSLYLMPRLQYYLSQKLFLDFNAPIILAKNQLKHNAIRDPQRSTSQQRYYTNDLQLFPAEFNFRIGLGVKI